MFKSVKEPKSPQDCDVKVVWLNAQAYVLTKDHPQWATCDLKFAVAFPGDYLKPDNVEYWKYDGKAPK